MEDKLKGDSLRVGTYEVRALSDQIAYQAGSIVSREIIRKEAGTVPCLLSTRIKD